MFTKEHLLTLAILSRGQNLQKILIYYTTQQNKISNLYTQISNSSQLNVFNENVQENTNENAPASVELRLTRNRSLLENDHLQP